MSKVIELDDDLLEDIRYGDGGRFNLVIAGPWISEGKWQYTESIYQEVETGLYYMTTTRRSGSEFTDYEWEMPTEMIQVERKEIVKVVWRPVK